MRKGKHRAPRRVFGTLAVFAVWAMVLALLPLAGGGAMADGRSSPVVTQPLIAGGGNGHGTQVGEVQVWNDADNVYVKYLITETGWCLMETHLAVAGSFDDIPQTKKGNPIPGKFDYSKSHDCTTEYTYTIPREGDWGADTRLYVAAHSVVKSAIDGCLETVWQIGDVEQKVKYPVDTPNAGETLLTNYADEFNWVGYGNSPAPTPFTLGPGLTTYEPPYTNPFHAGVTPDTEFPYNSNYARGYATDIDVVWDGALHFGGTLTVSWSPGASATEEKVVTDGGATTTLTRQGAPVSGQGYFLDKYPVYEEAPIAIGPYGTGTHTINFRQTKGDGTFWDWIRLERPCERSETAWGDGTAFPGKNWATYFTYDIAWQLIDTLFAPSRDPYGGNGTFSGNVALEPGVTYELRASGTYRFAKWGKYGIADAKCSYRDANHNGGTAGWFNGSGFASPLTNYLQVMLAGTPPEAIRWVAATEADSNGCDAGNLYTATVTGAGVELALTILDTYYGDNSGFVTVEIWGWQ